VKNGAKIYERALVYHHQPGIHTAGSTQNIDVHLNLVARQKKISKQIKYEKFELFSVFTHGPKGGRCHAKTGVNIKEFFQALVNVVAVDSSNPIELIVIVHKQNDDILNGLLIPPARV
jgi:hypothetical protein